MVRLSQTWKVRNVLVEMHGNNGSVDGDPAAAMRYTEARLSPIASKIFGNVISVGRRLLIATILKLYGICKSVFLYK